MSVDARRVISGMGQTHLNDIKKVIRADYIFLGKTHLQFRFNRDEVTYRQIIVRTALVLMYILHVSDEERRCYRFRQMLGYISLEIEKQNEFELIMLVASKVFEIASKFYLPKE